MATHIEKFGTHIRGVKDNASVVRSIATAERALNNFDASTTEREAIEAKLEAHKADKMISQLLKEKLDSFTGSDDAARVQLHALANQVGNTVSTYLKERAERARFADMSKEALRVEYRYFVELAKMFSPLFPVTDK